MDLYQLKMFFILAKVKSYTETAKIMCVTQSAVSHAIKKLEISVDTKLVKKKGREFQLTQAGLELFKSCEIIFYEIEKVTDDLKRHKEKAFWHVYLGSPVEFGTTILIRHIKDFAKTHPDIHLDFLFSHHLREPFLRDEVDFIIDCYDHPIPETEKIFLFREQYITIGSPEFVKKHRLEKARDLERVNILSLDKQALWWKNFLIALPENEQHVLKNIVRINHVRGIINGAINGMGIGFVPRYTVITELTNKILIDPFPDINPAADNFNIFIKRQKMKLKKNRILIDYLTKIRPVEFGVVDT